MATWHRCDDCGKFAKPEELEGDVIRSLSLYGDLREDYWQAHKEGFGCHALPNKETPNE